MKIVIADYDPLWPSRFEIERERIVTALDGIVRRIEHIGSTAVPGLAAKPIIDILVTVDDVENEAAYRACLEAAGYGLRIRESGHRMFRPSSQDLHVHLWQDGSDEAQRHVLFRDWLRLNADDRELYEQTKRELATSEWNSRQDYADAKTPVIEAITQRATTLGAAHKERKDLRSQGCR